MSTDKKKDDTRGKSGRSSEGWANLEAYKWKPGQSGNPKGRPRNRAVELLSTILTKKQVQMNTQLTEAEINAIENIILSLDIKALQQVAKNDDTPAYMKTLAMAAILDMKNGRTKTMDLLRDRQFGSVRKTVDVTTNGQSMTPVSMTPKEAKDMLRKIEESC